MLESADRRGAIEREVGELERLCAEGERHLQACDWGGFATVLRDARRARHALANAFNFPDPQADAAFERTMRQRASRVYAARERQLERLRAFNADVKGRLNVLARWKAAARKSAVYGEPRRGVAFESVQ